MTHLLLETQTEPKGQKSVLNPILCF